MAQQTTSSGFSARMSLPIRLTLVFILALIEFPLIAFIYDPFAINNTDAGWRAVQSSLRLAAPAVVFAFVATAVVLAPTRKKLFDQMRAASTAHDGVKALAVNVLLFALWLGVTKVFNLYGGQIASPPWMLFILWTAGVFCIYGLLALAAAPFSFWRRLVIEYRWHFLLAAGAGAMIQTAALLSQRSWSALSEATFQFSAFLLGLYESSVNADAPNRILGASGFDVSIAAECSGYEGIGLVTTFLAIYLWMFRKELRFPNAWLIFPIGIIAIWVMNAVRIALLISIGAHISPEIAITGFHSQAGWMMFLFVTIAIMIAIHNLTFFHIADTKTQTSKPAAYSEALALLAPFLAMTAAGIIAAAFSAGGHWLYALRVLAVGGALAWFWRYYRNLDWRCGWEPIVLGLIVGAAWIATDPGYGEENDLGLWLSSLAPSVAAMWIIMRVVGTILLAPMAEELAFRGYAHRKLISDKFENVAEGAFAWKAFLATTIVFGAIHERWLSGALAGAVFAIALYRSGKLSGAIIAHVVANALIAVWAIGFQQWSLF